MGYSPRSYDGYNEGNPEFSLLGESLGSDDGTTLRYSNCVSGGAQDGILDGSALGVPLGYTDGLMLDSDEGIRLGSTDGNLRGFTLGVDNAYTPVIDKVTTFFSSDE